MQTEGKPFGIIAIAIWAGFSAVIMLPVGFLLLLAGQVNGPSGVFFTGVGILSCVSGVALFAFMYGLWTLQEWGRSGMFWISAIFIPLGMISIFPIWPDQEMTTGNTVLQVVGISIDILIMFYLNRGNVREWFIQG